MSDALVLTEIHPSGYAVLTLNRPAALNALSRALMAQLGESPASCAAAADRKSAA